ncbi:MAG: hypothetical protein JWQ55_922, partial [Rhodopila sp.]|nr:hypothetical protein [Rhodopila sp.]
AGDPPPFCVTAGFGPATRDFPQAGTASGALAASPPSSTHMQASVSIY